MSENRDEDSVAFEAPNAADDRRHRRRRDQAKREEEEAKTFWRAVFANQVGRREMWRILMLGHVFEERFAADGIGEKTWVLAGEQRLAWRLYQMWRRADFDGVSLMHREHDAEAGATLPND